MEWKAGGVSLLVFCNGEFEEFFVGAVEDIDIYVAFDAVDLASVGVLPYFPLAFVGEFFHVVVGNPEGIAVELGCVEVVDAE